MPLLTKIFTIKITKDNSINKITLFIKKANKQVYLINNKAILNDIVLGLIIINIFRKIRKFSLAIYRIKNNKEIFLFKRVI